jgi:hypothetical protein
MTRTAEPCRGRLQTPTAPVFSTTENAGLSFARKAKPVASSVYEFSGESARYAGAVVLEDETPRRKFVKDLIRVGEYVNGGENISITDADLDLWVDETRKWIANGNAVPVPDGHTDEATANRGYVLDVFREGDTLYGVIEMIGEDGIKTAARSKVSIKTDVDYTDGKGQKYSHVITHVALTNEPVVPDQDGFIPIAASRGGKPTRARLFRLAQNTEPTNMEALNKIATMLGVEAVESLDEAGLVAAIAKAIESMQKMSKDKDGVEEEVAAAKAELSALKASLKKAPVDPLMAKVIGENRGLKLSRLVSESRITPAVKDKLAAMQFSIDEAGEAQFESLVAALSNNDPVKLGEQTRAQGVALSRNTGGEATATDADTVKRLARHIGVTVK